MDNFDNNFETFEQFEQRMRLDDFYGDFSSETKKKMLAKNLPSISNVYDVLYAQTRNDMLAKNPEIIDINSANDSDIIRLNNLKKNVASSVDFDTLNDQARKQNQSKNILVDSASTLENIGNKKREELLSKNNMSLSLPDESIIRDNQLASNVPSKINIDTYASTELTDELSANAPNKINIDT